jgi:hypothetical protein
VRSPRNDQGEIAERYQRKERESARVVRP